MTLHCTKTGRHWPCMTEEQAKTMARELGLTGYTFCPPGTFPATIRDTTAAMRARQMNAELPEEQRAMMKLKGMM